MDTASWKAWKANDGRTVTYVGMSGNTTAHGTLLTVSASGIRVRLDSGTTERFHPEHVMPGRM